MATKRILIIDDEERIREVVRACLEDLAGWLTIVAESGQQGLLKAETEALDAILLDVSMPDMDGLTLFQLLQDNAATRSIPVILLTAKVLPADQASFADLGVAGVITKPFNALSLSTDIAQLLNWDIQT